MVAKGLMNYLKDLSKSMSVFLKCEIKIKTKEKGLSNFNIHQKLCF